MSRVLSCLLAAWLVLAAASGRPAAAEEALTPAQRDAMEQLVHDYILKHPEVLIQSLQGAEEKEKLAAAERGRKALAEKRAELFEDPASPVGGNPKGDITIVEFFDYRCPYCKEVEPSLEALLREDGHVRLVYKEFPVLGPASIYASRVALAALKQGKYDAFHKAMIATQGSIDTKVVQSVAEGVGIDPDRLKSDTAAPEVDAQIKRNYALAQALEIRGTPAFILGDEIIPGAIDIATLRQKIAAARKK